MCPESYVNTETFTTIMVAEVFFVSKELYLYEHVSNETKMLRVY